MRWKRVVILGFCKTSKYSGFYRIQRIALTSYYDEEEKDLIVLDDCEEILDSDKSRLGGRRGEVKLLYII